MITHNLGGLQCKLQAHVDQRQPGLKSYRATLSGEPKTTRFECVASSNLCNRQVKQDEDLVQCLPGVLTDNLREANITPEKGDFP